MEKSTIQYIPCMDFASGTSLQHAGVELSYNDLVRMFGEPHFEGIGDKTTTEWTIEYQKYEAEWDERQDGVFTIYDWHFARNLNDNYAKTSWNIGGRNINDYFAFMEAMEIYNRTNDEIDIMEDGILTHARYHELPEVGSVA